MSGRPPPPCPPSAADADAHQIDGAEALGQVVGDADHHAALPSSPTPTKTTTPEPSALLALVGQRLQVLRRDAGHRACRGSRRRRPSRPAAAIGRRRRRRARASCAPRPARVRACGARRAAPRRAPAPRPAATFSVAGDRLQPLVLLVEIARAPPRRSAPRCGARRRRRRFRRRCARGRCRRWRATWVPPHSSTE